jgi:hypothetical protein
MRQRLTRLRSQFPHNDRQNGHSFMDSALMLKLRREENRTKKDLSIPSARSGFGWIFVPFITVQSIHE